MMEKPEKPNIYRTLSYKTPCEIECHLGTVNVLLSMTAMTFPY